MNISDLIKKLEKLKKEFGDIPVKVQTLTHIWDPELAIKGRGLHKKGEDIFVLLNS